MSDDTETPTPAPARRVSMTVTAYLTGHLGGFYDLQSRPDGGEAWSVPEHCVDERSVTDLPPEPLTRDDWDEITGTLTARLGEAVGGRLADEWRRIALGVQQEQAARFRDRPAKTIEQLAAEQGVPPIESIDDLAGLDVAAEEMDAFLAAIHERVDPQRDAFEDLLAVIELYIGRFVVQRLTTEQRNLFAAAVDASNARRAAADPAYGEPRKVERWWSE